MLKRHWRRLERSFADPLSACMGEDMTAPFGIELHSPVDQLEIVRDLGQGKYSVTPPKPHPSFEMYVVQATPGMGVFWIKAISATVENDAYGTQTRGLQEKVHGQLSKRYGPGVFTDRLTYGSIWNEPRDWTQGLTANERFHFVIWERPKSPELPDDIQSIYLGATGYGSDQAGVCIEYSSVRMKDAEEELEELLSDLL
jgi:hypothetical protein